jgi:hypothetical protein
MGMKAILEMHKILLLPLGLVAMLALSCAKPVPPPPHSLAEYEWMCRSSARGTYPRRTILMRNLQRVLNSELSTVQRVASLQLVLHLGADDETVREQLFTVLREPSSPYELHQVVLPFLLEKDYPDLAGYVVSGLARSDQDPKLREECLQWISRHPTPEVLGEVVKLWAVEDSVSGVNELKYRHIVERIAGQSWDTALLEGISGKRTFPRGRALEILIKRISTDSLKQRILRMGPKTDAMAALQSFLENFDYLPADRTQFAAVVTIFKNRLKLMSGAASLAKQWGVDYGYQFNVRDFHLLSRMASDPFRTMFRRSHLILELSKSLATRRHVHYSHRIHNRGRVPTVRFSLQVEMLSICDLWNLYLLDEMLNRPRMQLALKIIADRSRTDPDSTYSGLIFYRNGQPEAMLYPPTRSGNEESFDDDEDPRLTRDTRDAISRFRTHFSKVNNISRTGPSVDELRQAREGNYYGLILTSVNKHAFCAHYYNSNGLVISLGNFPFER